MKRFLLTAFMMLVVLCIRAQVTPSTVLRVANSSTAFGENLPIGSIIYDVATNKNYQLLTGAANTASISTLTIDVNYRELISDIAYNATTWDGNIDAPTKNAIRDKLESMSGMTTYDMSLTSPLSFTVGAGTDLVLTNDVTIAIADAAADGATKGAASFTANDFDASSGNISIDYTNGTAATTSTKGFLTAADWNTFDGKSDVSVANQGDNRIITATGTTDALNAESGLTYNGSFLAVSGGINVTGVVKIDPTPASNDWSGSVVTATAGETLALGDLCYFKSDGYMWLADADAQASSQAMYVCTESLSASGSGVFVRDGYINVSTWSWTTGNLLYVSQTAGDFTATAPSATGSYVVIVGQAESSTIIHFRPRFGWVKIN